MQATHKVLAQAIYPLMKFIYRLNDKTISFSKGKVIVLWYLIFAFNEKATHRSLCSPPEGFD
jgi:hypothetical protein